MPTKSAQVSKNLNVIQKRRKNSKTPGTAGAYKQGVSAAKKAASKKEK